MIFVDIDGTCANITHRLPYIQGGQKNWAKFLDPEEVSKDTPIESIRLLVQTCQQAGHELIYVSGRPESLRWTTRNWLRDHAFPEAGCYLYMRKDGDFRADYIIKEEILLSLGRMPEFVIDDRPQVCDMWRRHGIPVVQLPWHEEKKMKNRGFLTLMVGPSGAGKSTILRGSESGYDFPESLDLDALRSSRYFQRIVLSSDGFRERMFGDRSDQTHNHEVFEVLHANAVAMLAAGIHVIIDATHLRRKDRLDAVALAQGGPVRYIVMDRPNKTPWHGNMDVVRKHEQMFASQLKDILAGDNLPNVTVYDWRIT